ncbi:MAG: hypothetical protein ACK4YK_10480 [Dolichospermum sp.]|jgi:hypothetical protein
MITTNFQKWGALVASLASILTLSSAAEAIVITSPTGPSSGKYNITTAPASGAPSRTNLSVPISYTGTPFEIQSLNSVTINGLSLNGNKGRLTAKLTAFDVTSNSEIQSVSLFSTFATTGSSSALSLGNYKFVQDSGSTWATNSSVPGTYTAVDSLTGASLADFSGLFFNSNTRWTLDIGNGRNTNSSTGSFSSFSIDASPVPFESNAAPAGVAIVFGTLMLRRKLQQRSAQKMSLESVNS